MLNIMRCDYFLDSKKLSNLKNNIIALSQVEFNTLGCGGTATPSKVLELRKYYAWRYLNLNLNRRIFIKSITKPVFQGIC